MDAEIEEDNDEEELEVPQTFNTTGNDAHQQEVSKQKNSNFNQLDNSKDVSSSKTHRDSNHNETKEKEKEMKLVDLLNSSIGPLVTTDKCNLNLSMLYNLLLSLIDKLGMSDTQVLVPGFAFPTTTKLMKEVHKEPKVISDLWGQIQLQKQTEANREGITRLTELVTDLLAKMGKITGLKDDVAGLAGELLRLSQDADDTR